MIDIPFLLSIVGFVLIYAAVGIGAYSRRSARWAFACMFTGLAILAALLVVEAVAGGPG